MKKKKMDWPLVANATSMASVTTASTGGDRCGILLRPPVSHARSASCDVWPSPEHHSAGRSIRPSGRRPRRESSSDLSSAEEGYFDGGSPRRGPPMLLKAADEEGAFGAPPPLQRCGSVPPHLGLSATPSRAAVTGSPKLPSSSGQRAAASPLHQRPPFAALSTTAGGGSASREVDFRSTPFGHQQHHHRHHQNASSPVNLQRNSLKNKTNKWAWLWHRKGDPSSGAGGGLESRPKEAEEGVGGRSSRDSSTSSCKSGGPAAAMGVKRRFRVTPHISCPDISSASSDSESTKTWHAAPSPTLPFRVSISSIFQRPSSQRSSSQRLPRNSSLRYQNRTADLPSGRSTIAAGCYDSEDSPRIRPRKRTLTGTQIGGLWVEGAAAGKGSASDNQQERHPSDFVAPLARYKLVAAMEKLLSAETESFFQV